jgi:beta-galactosidase
VKKVYQNIQIKAVDLAQGKIEIKNGYFFTNLNEIVNGSWSISADDKVIETGALSNLNIEPEEILEVTIPFKAVSPEPGVEYFLNLSFKLKEKQMWAPAGHELAWEQFKLPIEKPAVVMNPAQMPSLNVTDQGGIVKVEGENFSVTVDKATGFLSSMRYKNTELVKEPLAPNFWRAPTDNDRGNEMPKRCAVWKTAMQNWKVRSVEANQISPQVVQVKVVSHIKDVQGDYTLSYQIYGDGSVVVDMEGQANKAELPEIPKFGMKVALPQGFETIRWFGRGPQETYWDRCDARVDLYEGTVDEQYFEYSEPTESGNKVDVRWVALTNDNGMGLLAVGMPLLSVCALHYTAEDLDGPIHLYEVQHRDDIYLNLDYRQMGVGGDDSWGARTHSEFTLSANQRYSYRFCLRPYDSSMGNVQKIARKATPAPIQ